MTDLKAATPTKNELVYSSTADVSSEDDVRSTGGKRTWRSFFWSCKSTPRESK